jgi:hypothetical protein
METFHPFAKYWYIYSENFHKNIALNTGIFIKKTLMEAFHYLQE